MGKFGLLGIAAAFAIYIVVRWIDRIRFMRQLRMARITVPELATLLSSDKEPIHLDVRRTVSVIGLSFVVSLGVAHAGPRDQA